MRRVEAVRARWQEGVYARGLRGDDKTPLHVDHDWLIERVDEMRKAIEQHIAADECGTGSLRAALAALDEED